MIFFASAQLSTRANLHVGKIYDALEEQRGRAPHRRAAPPSKLAIAQPPRRLAVGAKQHALAHVFARLEEAHLHKAVGIPIRARSPPSYPP